MRFFIVATFCAVASPLLVQAQATFPSLGGCSLLPANNVWHARVDNLPVHPNSSAYVASLGAASPLHPDFGYSLDNGIPYNLVPGNSTPPANVSVLWPFTSDPGPYPIPATAIAETPSDPSNPNDDHHLIVVDTDNCLLYEAYLAILTSAATDSWSVDSISKFNLNSNALKPANWSSSNAAGTTYLPGLIRYDEVAAGHIDHAIAMTATGIGNTYIWPASRTASSLSGSQYPPMGTRFRLKSSVDISGFTPNVRVVLEALKTYGAIVIDNGASWFMVGVPDTRWNDSEMHTMTELDGSDFEAVDESSLMISSSSGQVTAGAIPTGWVNIVNQLSGKCLETTPGLMSFYANSAGLEGLHQWTCNGSQAQEFQLTPATGSWNPGNSVEWVSATGTGYIIDSALTGRQVGAPSGAQLGAQPMVSAFSDSADWIWTPVSVGGGYFYIQSLGSGLVFDNVYQTGYANGSALQLWSYLGGVNQLWKFVPVTEQTTAAADRHELIDFAAFH